MFDLFLWRNAGKFKSIDATARVVVSGWLNIETLLEDAGSSRIGSNNTVKEAGNAKTRDHSATKVDGGHADFRAVGTLREICTAHVTGY